MREIEAAPGVRVIFGDALEALKTLPAESVNCVVTSPPYWGLRDYSRCPCSLTEPRSVGDPGNAQGGAASLAGGRPRAEGPDPKCRVCGGSGIVPGVNEMQIGREDSVEAYIGRIVAVFDEVHRILRKDGTLWLNLGDTYFGDSAGNRRSAARAGGLKPKDLVGIPWRVAFALRDAGWYLRAEVIWNKPNPMPDSTKDRPTRAHEQIFLLAKESHYAYDDDAIREAWTDQRTADLERAQFGHKKYGGKWNAEVGGKFRESKVAGHPSQGRSSRTVRDAPEPSHEQVFLMSKSERYAYDGDAIKESWAESSVDRARHHLPNPKDNPSPASKHGRGRRAYPLLDPIWPGIGGKHGGQRHRGEDPTAMAASSERNARTVWTFPTSAYKGAHYATFPPALAERCILAGCPKEVCAKCGAPRTRVTKRWKASSPGQPRANTPAAGPKAKGAKAQAHPETHRRYPVRYETQVETLGWAPSCDCGAGARPGVVLDPFAGSGTVGQVARFLGRHAVLVELVETNEYLIRERVRRDLVRRWR